MAGTVRKATIAKLEAERKKVIKVLDALDSTIRDLKQRRRQAPKSKARMARRRPKAG